MRPLKESIGDKITSDDCSTEAMDKGIERCIAPSDRELAEFIYGDASGDSFNFFDDEEVKDLRSLDIYMKLEDIVCDPSMSEQTKKECFSEDNISQFYGLPCKAYSLKARRSEEDGVFFVVTFTISDEVLDEYEDINNETYYTELPLKDRRKIAEFCGYFSQNESIGVRIASEQDADATKKMDDVVADKLALVYQKLVKEENSAVGEGEKYYELLCKKELPKEISRELSLKDGIENINFLYSIYIYDDNTEFGTKSKFIQDLDIDDAKQFIFASFGYDENSNWENDDVEFRLITNLSDNVQDFIYKTILNMNESIGEHIVDDEGKTLEKKAKRAADFSYEIGDPYPRTNPFAMVVSLSPFRVVSTTASFGNFYEALEWKPKGHEELDWYLPTSEEWEEIRSLWFRNNISWSKFHFTKGWTWTNNLIRRKYARSIFIPYGRFGSSIGSSSCQETKKDDTHYINKFLRIQELDESIGKRIDSSDSEGKILHTAELLATDKAEPLDTLEYMEQDLTMMSDSRNNENNQNAWYLYEDEDEQIRNTELVYKNGYNDFISEWDETWTRETDEVNNYTEDDETEDENYDPFDEEADFDNYYEGDGSNATVNYQVKIKTVRGQKFAIQLYGYNSMTSLYKSHSLYHNLADSTFSDEKVAEAIEERDLGLFLEAVQDIFKKNFEYNPINIDESIGERISDNEIEDEDVNLLALTLEELSVLICDTAFKNSELVRERDDYRDFFFTTKEKIDLSPFIEKTAPLKILRIYKEEVYRNNFDGFVLSDSKFTSTLQTKKGTIKGNGNYISNFIFYNKECSESKKREVLVRLFDYLIKDLKMKKGE